MGFKARKYDIHLFGYISDINAYINLADYE